MKVFLVLLLLPFSLFAQPRKSPKLVVGIVVDQMRYDYIARYWDKFAEGGFKRLVNGGLNCENTHYNYVPTYTGPGHTSIFAGATPATHGIVSNDWYSREEGKAVYCAEDASVASVGGHVLSGTFSPKRLMASNISDELRIHSMFKSKVIGIAIKDRGAILPAGHTPNAAYWYDLNNTGNWMTSTYYMKDLPQWVKDFNAKGLAQMYLSVPWETMMPIEQYTESSPDDSPYEGKFKGEEKPIFPHNLPVLAATSGVKLLAATPYGNTYTKEFAKAAILGEALGKDNYPDLLTLSFSSTDYIGHQFGTTAIETEDAYLRLDRDLDDFLGFLDMQVGKGQYTVFLTADHGGANTPKFLQDHHIPAKNYSPDSIKQKIENFLRPKYGDSIVLAEMNNQIYLNYNTIEKKKLNKSEIADAIADFALTLEGISATVTASTLQKQEFTKGVLNKVQNGFQTKRSGDVMLIFEPAWLDYGVTGTSHGSPYPYDTHVPLLWYGFGVPVGIVAETVEITDIAPTLAMMLNVPLPNGCTGKSLMNYFKIAKK